MILTSPKILRVFFYKEAVMEKCYKQSIFIFRRDLRLEDNTGLIRATKQSKRVIPCFIFDPKQVKKHQYRSLNALEFMIESLFDLENHIAKKKGKLQFFYGNPKEVLKNIFATCEIEAVFVNRDYTPFSIKRDEEIKGFCQEMRIAFHQEKDLLLNEPEDIKKNDGTPYKVFTAFFKKALASSVCPPIIFNTWNFKKTKIRGSNSLRNICKEIEYKNNPNIFVKGGREEVEKKLAHLSRYKNYDKDRNFPSCEGTTGLSAYNKFGICSIREFYHAIVNTLGETHTLKRELYWRDFFTHIAFHFPKVFGACFYEKYEKLHWKNEAKTFSKWCQGETGFPIVDAGMRELNTTGYMHNRVRMIVASFLTKDLQIDWRLGEKYFAQKLIDYDPCVNNGNWQWAASTGCDAQPYFRIFNPWLQQKKFDPQTHYIKKWILELADKKPTVIHNWFKDTVRKKEESSYPDPIIDHARASKKAKQMFLAIK